MGTHEPPEHWAPPESLDPTPVWKQYILVALLALAFLAVVGGYTLVAAAPDVVQPPAVVFNRVVLAASDYPPGTTRLVTLLDAERQFFLSHVGGEYVAVLRSWPPDVNGPERCTIGLVAAPSDAKERFVDSCAGSTFDVDGLVVAGPAERGLDRYLVSIKGERVVVNLDHVIQGARR